MKEFNQKGATMYQALERFVGMASLAQDMVPVNVVRGQPTFTIDTDADCEVTASITVARMKVQRLLKDGARVVWVRLSTSRLPFAVIWTDDEGMTHALSLPPKRDLIRMRCRVYGVPECDTAVTGA